MSARVHPGETVASFVLQGVVEYLVGRQGAALRNRYVFKIVPMLNPDGVIHGNYRCNLSGKDLNRCWKQPHSITESEIYHFKALIKDLSKKYKIVAFCDFHGHSKKKDSFVYGCHHKVNPLLSRGLPFTLSKHCKYFSFKDCSFQIEASKEGTARVVLYKALGIPNIFTLESSFCGPSWENVHFN
jgi:hypothetical protein